MEKSQLFNSSKEWVEKNLSNFDPLHWTEKKAAYTRRKAFAELAIYAQVYLSYYEDDHSRTLTKFICNVANDPSFIRLLLRNPRQILLYSAPIAFTLSVGKASNPLINGLEKVLKSKQPFAVERSSHRLMDLWQFLTIINRCPDWLDENTILRHSCLHNMLSPFDFTLSEAYAFTHNILFMKNFGAKDERFKTRSHDLDRTSISLIMSKYFYEDNSDILLELAMVMGLLGQLNKRDYHLVSNWLESRNEGCDYIKGPQFDPDKSIKYSGLDKDWVCNYHTTLVGLSFFVLAKNLKWDNAKSNIEPCLSSSVEEMEAWGKIIDQINTYQLPAAVASLENTPVNSLFSRSAFSAVSEHFVSILDSELGVYGYWEDEIKAEKNENLSDLLPELVTTSSLMREILDSKASEIKLLVSQN